jgi:hypothetical protein
VEPAVTRAHHSRRRDTNEPAIVRALHAVGATVEKLDNAGVPDLLVGFCKQTFLLEVKRPLGPRGGDSSELTEDQLRWHAAWKGRPIAIVRTVDEALTAIGAV